MAQKQAWEYRCWTWVPTERKPETCVDFEVIKLFGEAGKDGWELVNAVPLGAGAWCGFFKRPLLAKRR
jgi:hypothetical protein